MSRDVFARYRARMEAAGFRPSRRLGQNFLLDPSLHRALIDLAGVRAGDLVLEVGAGLGFLTRELAARGARVVAVEVDARLERLLRDDLADLSPDPGVRLCLGDALEGGVIAPWLVDLVARERAGRRRWLLVANLPYKIAGPLLAGLPVLDEPPEQAAVLVQAELAERVASAPGQRTYGGLSALLQAAYRPEVGRRVGREVFRPRPNVDSAFLALRPGGEPGLTALPAELRRGFARFLRELFSARRKKLRNVLGRACETVGVAAPPALAGDLAERRAEALSPAELVEIWYQVASLS